MASCRALIPRAGIGFNGGTAALEGWLNIYDGSSYWSKFLGYGYDGDEPDGTFFYVAGGSRWESEDKTICNGGPERFLRGFGGFTIKGNRDIFGAGTSPHVDAIIDTQAGGLLTILRGSIAPGIRRAILVGAGVGAYLPQNFVRGGLTSTIEVNGAGAYALCAPIQIRDGVRGIYAHSGGVAKVSGDSDIDYCGTDLAILSGGRILGDPYNGSDDPGNSGKQATVKRNTSKYGGYWLADDTANLAYEGLALGGTNPVLIFGEGGKLNANSGHVELHTGTPGRDFSFYAGEDTANKVLGLDCGTKQVLAFGDVLRDGTKVLSSRVIDGDLAAVGASPTVEELSTALNAAIAVILAHGLGAAS